jgi:hypothetical protein
VWYWAYIIHLATAVYIMRIVELTEWMCCSWSNNCDYDKLPILMPEIDIFIPWLVHLSRFPMSSHRPSVGFARVLPSPSASPRHNPVVSTLETTGTALPGGGWRRWGTWDRQPIDTQAGMKEMHRRSIGHFWNMKECIVVVSGTFEIWKNASS